MRSRFILLFLSLQACSVTGLLPVTSGQGTAVPIPRVILNCQTSRCRTNMTAPLVSVVVTASSCSDPLFGAVISSSTRALSCDSLTGCYGEITGWTGASGPTTTLPSSSYNICVCINASGGAQPWMNCSSVGEKDGVTMDSSTGLQSITSWLDP